MKLARDARIGIGWAICTFGGLYSFYLSKTSIEKRRYENMKARQRMKTSNVGEYEQSYRKFPTTAEKLEEN